MTRKILYSPGYGAGWTTWEDDPEVKAIMLTYQPLIDAIESNQPIQPALDQLKVELTAKGLDYPYDGGAHSLKIHKADGRVHIKEYDGNESVIDEGCNDYWM